MPKVIFNYNKCNGTGECVDICPVEVLELSENGRWCKAIDDEVENKETVDKFHKEVEDADAPVDLILEYDVPECVACMACEASCPQEAVTVEE